ncbi:glycosyltransferase [Paenibacillus sp. MY03]|uniref:glycosyltransferase n=1 Tax=Paenibacillus sp. MY03 TaxID=302980 RepID=UPI0015C5FE31|nr:glycosyltransferase [Paenibacillus sp. MY03]
MEQIKVTFLMMAYNAEKYIAKAIESVLNQTERSIVLCIRNNGSTDSTGEIIRRYAELDSRIHVVENEKNNVSQEGITPFQTGWWPYTEETAGEYFSIIDSDDYLAPDFAEVMYSAAKRASADMVVAGHYFVNEETNEVVGQRTPPRVEMDKIEEIGVNFVQLYNGMRTWWGKLFQKDFFIRHHSECWDNIEPLSWTIDTVVMLNYLVRCRMLVCIDRPLYYFLSRKNSSYNTRPFGYLRLCEADILYLAGFNVLDKLNIRSLENEAFLLNLHWTYIVEALNGLNHTSNMISPLKTLERLGDLFSNSIVSSYLESSFAQIFVTCEPYIRRAMNSEQEKNVIWGSYLSRLVYLMEQVPQDTKLYFPLLLSCVCDPQNKNRAGRGFILKANQENNNTSYGQKWFLSCSRQIQEYYYEHPQLLVEEIDSRDRDDSLTEKENLLIESFQQEDMAKACDLIEEISQQSPLNRIAMYYRIYVATLIDEFPLALVMAASAKVLWPNDMDIQLLYWNILNSSND